MATCTAISFKHRYGLSRDITVHIPFYYPKGRAHNAAIWAIAKALSEHPLDFRDIQIEELEEHVVGIHHF